MDEITHTRIEGAQTLDATVSTSRVFGSHNRLRIADEAYTVASNAYKTNPTEETLAACIKARDEYDFEYWCQVDKGSE